MSALEGSILYRCSGLYIPKKRERANGAQTEKQTVRQSGSQTVRLPDSQTVRQSESQPFSFEENCVLTGLVSKYNRKVNSVKLGSHTASRIMCLSVGAAQSV